MLNYHEIRKLSPEKAREVARRILAGNGGNVTRAAGILGIRPRTVRRARDGALSDSSKRPHSSPNRTASPLEDLIVHEGRETGYRCRRLSNLLFDKYGLAVPEDTVKAVLKRMGVGGKRVRTANKRRRPLYDYEHLAPFAEMQLDTKHVLDLNALPTDVYRHILKWNLPRYEWNAIDAATRIRFTAYSHELSATFGWLFMLIVIHWLRAHGIRHGIHIQGDNGSELCAGSKAKELELNGLLNPLGSSFTSIPAGKKYLQALVENSHRHDDEQFLSIHPIRCRNDRSFIGRAQRWQDTWNAGRRSQGIGMGNKTPLGKLRQKDDLIHPHIVQFPVMLMEDILKTGGSYVPTKCQLSGKD
jgi:hypothetical protein